MARSDKELEVDVLWNILSGNLAWDVSVMHNFWDGSRYCQGFRPLSVLAGSKHEAILAVKYNLSVVETHFRSKRMRRGGGTIRLVRKSESYHIKESSIHNVKESFLISGPIMTTAGEWISYNRDEHELTP